MDHDRKVLSYWLAAGCFALTTLGCMILFSQERDRRALSFAIEHGVNPAMAACAFNLGTFSPVTCGILASPQK